MNTQATANHVDHRIAIVGFSSTGGSYYNTELLSGQNLQQRNMNVVGPVHNDNDGYYYFPDGVNYYGPQYSGTGLGGIDPDNYVNALVDASTSAGVSKLKEASAAVTAYGGTEPEYGLYMAHNIFGQRPTTPEDTTKFEKKDGSLQDRGKVVVFFTDGQPGNQAYSDQIAAANRVVTAANTLKVNDNATIYSVGIFEGGDNQPLTYAKTNEDDALDKANYQSIINVNNTTYFLMRGNSVGYTPHNDTIADYMKCVSSAYPTATNFLAGSIDGGTAETSRGTEQTDKQYYMYVSDSAGLERAFSSVVSNIDTTTSDVTASSSSVLIDVVNTSDFTLPADFEGSVTAKAVVLNPDLSTGADDSTITPSITLPKDTNGNYTGAVQVSGFDYSSNYVAAGRTGRMLVVEIKGLTPAQAGEILSNTDAKIVKSTTDNTTFVSLTESPKDTVGQRTVVMDFGATAVLAKKATGENAKTNLAGATSTHFVNDNSKVTFSYDKNLAQADGGTVDLSFSGVESAMVYGKQVTGTAADGTITTENTAVWKQVNIVPANSIYFDDTMESTEAGFDASGVGYNAALTGDTKANDAAGNDQGQATLTFTFTGDGIDVYCTTPNANGWIQATVDGTNKQPYTNTKYAGGGELHNIPVISFRSLGTGTHTLVITTLTNSNFKLDGIRVYNTTQDATGDDATKVNNAYAAANEQNAVFMQVRQYLLDSKTFGSLTANDDDTKAFTGAVFVDTKTTGAAVSDYEKSGPKNEVYLDANQGVAFQIKGWANFKNTNKVMVGLSVPAGGSATVAASGRTGNKKIEVNSETTMFYNITPDENGNVYIFNTTGSSMVSVTDLKITGTEKYVAPLTFTLGAPVAPESEGGALTVQPMMLMRYVEDFDPEAVIEDPVVVDDPQTPDTPDDGDKPGWNDDAYNPVNILKTLFKLLLESLSSLFGGLGNW